MMAPPIYFLPGISRHQLAPEGVLSRSILSARGLGELLPPGDIDSVKDLALGDVARGPNSKSGCLLVALPADRSRDFVCSYKAATQTWQPIGDGELLWLGIDNTQGKPEPADLQRKTVHPGYAVTLADGNAWTIPVIRRPDESTTLPKSLGYDDAGKFRQIVKEAYRQLWEDTAEVIELYFGAGDYELEWGFNFAMRVLSLNYRYDRHLHNVLDLIDSTNLSQAEEAKAIEHPGILDAVIDAPLLLRVIAKKNAAVPPGEPTPPGSKD